MRLSTKTSFHFILYSPESPVINHSFRLVLSTFPSTQAQASTNPSNKPLIVASMYPPSNHATTANDSFLRVLPSRPQSRARHRVFVYCRLASHPSYPCRHRLFRCPDGFGGSDGRNGRARTADEHNPPKWSRRWSELRAGYLEFL